MDSSWHLPGFTPAQPIGDLTPDARLVPSSTPATPPQAPIGNKALLLSSCKIHLKYRRCKDLSAVVAGAWRDGRRARAEARRSAAPYRHTGPPSTGGPGQGAAGFAGRHRPSSPHSRLQITLHHLHIFLPHPTSHILHIFLPHSASHHLYIFLPHPASHLLNLHPATHTHKKKYMMTC